MRNMTEGSIGRHLIQYAVPMILGNLFQLTYNAADSVIIGKFLGENALAAVATSNPVMTIMILGASGIGIGASVIMGKFYGAKDHAALKREFSTTVISCTVFSLLVFLLGSLLTPEILTWRYRICGSSSSAFYFLSNIISCPTRCEASAIPGRRWFFCRCPVC